MLKPKNLLSKHKYPFFLVLAGLLLLAIFNWLLDYRQRDILFADSGNYLEAAQNLYLDFSVHYFRPILMSAINGIPLVFGFDEIAVLNWSFFVNVCCWILTSILVFKTICFFASEKIAFVFALVTLLFVGNLALTFHLLTENIYICFISSGSYLIFKYAKEKRFIFLASALAIFLLSMLIKPGSKFLAIVVCLYFTVELYRNFKKRSMLLVYGSILIIGFQLAGMKKQYGDYTISYIDGVTCYNYLCSRAICIKNGIAFNASANERTFVINSLDYSTGKKLAVNDLKIQVLENPLNLSKAYLANVYDNTKTGNSAVDFTKNVKKSNHFETIKLLLYNISKWQNRLFTVLGILLAAFFMWKKFRTEKATAVVAFFIVYIIATSGISSSEGDRFHLVTFPFTIVLLAKYVTERKQILNH